MPDLVDIKDVELVREGVYDLMTGPVSFTRGRLETAVANSTSRAPRIKISFDDVHAAGSPNAPSLGNVADMRLVEDGDVLTIRGDLVGVPKTLADIMPSAYPTRSIEASAKGDDMTITALELLGITAPGVHDIEDLRKLYDGETELALAAAAPVEDANGDTFTVALAAAINLDDLRSAFYERQRGTGPFGGPFEDWWVDEIHMDPNELIVKNGAAAYRVPWTVDADRSFTFDDPVEVVVQFVDKVSASAGPVVAYRAAASARPNHTQEESVMDPKHLRESIGLAEDASDEDVTAKLAELNARPDETKVEEQLAAAKADALKEAKKDVKPEVPDGFTMVSTEDLESLKASGAAGVKALEKQESEEDERILASGAAKGKYGPATRDKLAAAMKKDRAQTREFIESLPDGVVPVTETGGDAPEDIAASAGDDEAYTAYMKDHHGIEVTA